MMLVLDVGCWMLMLAETMLLSDESYYLLIYYDEQLRISAPSPGDEFAKGKDYVSKNFRNATAEVPQYSDFVRMATADSKSIE